jgi:PTH1 family peptidyl-tRNA hydrolase
MLRVRMRGSDGGHNGLASIIYTLGSEDFPRLRIGIGPVPPQTDPADFVLSRFEAAELAAMEAARRDACEAVLTIASGGLDKAMNKYNRRVEEDRD